MSTKRKGTKKPWPTKDAMEQIYDKNLWGGDGYYSGSGSHDLDIVDPYVDVVTRFLESIGLPTVVDLGCGDFNVGHQLVKYSKQYIAIDIAQNVIEHNKQIYKEKNLEFRCLDISLDQLPTGDCAIVRQVLQHLSNDEVKKVVGQLSKYKYVIFTDHLPQGNFEANQDIISGQGIRLKKQSGLNLLVSPFNFEVKSEKELLSYELEKGKIVTTLYVIN